MTSTTDLQLQAKQKCAHHAVDSFVKSNSIIGLGTGSTAHFAIEYIGKKHNAKELSDITCVATSEDTAQKARNAGLTVVELDSLEDRLIDVAIDGADEISPSLQVVKGRGGALLREKLTELRAKTFVIIVDDSKLVEKLGKGTIPVEVVTFGSKSTMQRLRKVLQPHLEVLSLRLNKDGKPHITDQGNYTVDLTFRDGGIPNEKVESIASAIKLTHGVVEHGLFLNFNPKVVVANTATGDIKILGQ